MQIHNRVDFLVEYGNRRRAGKIGTMQLRTTGEWGLTDIPKVELVFDRRCLFTVLFAMETHYFGGSSIDRIIVWPKNIGPSVP